jgi:hypothetical protein
LNLKKKYDYEMNFYLIGKTLMDEQDWYEKDLSDFDDPQLSDEEHEG